MGARGDRERVRKLLEELRELRREGSYEDRRQLLLQGLGTRDDLDKGTSSRVEDSLSPLVAINQQRDLEVVLKVRNIFHDALRRANSGEPKAVYEAFLEGLNGVSLPSVRFNSERHIINAKGFSFGKDYEAFIDWIREQYVDTE